MADDEPDSTYDEDDPRADPETSWVRVPFYGSEEIGYRDPGGTLVVLAEFFETEEKHSAGAGDS